MLNRTIEEMEKHANQLPDDKAYVQWVGQLFDDNNDFVRYDTVELIAIYWRKNKPVYRHIPASLIKNFNKEPQLLFTTAPMVKVLSGIRANRVVPDDAVFPSEDFESVGIYRRLEVGSAVNTFSPLRPKDVKYAENIQSLCTALSRDEELAPFVIPACHLTCRGEGHHFLRQGSEKWFSDLTGQVNFTLASLPKEYVVNAGNGRTGYPFEHIYGKGIVAMDPAHMGKWSLVDLCQLNIEKPYMKLSVQ